MWHEKMRIWPRSTLAPMPILKYSEEEIKSAVQRRTIRCEMKARRTYCSCELVVHLHMLVDASKSVGALKERHCCNI
jgi:hypothetical protein